MKVENILLLLLTFLQMQKVGCWVGKFVKRFWYCITFDNSSPACYLRLVTTLHSLILSSSPAARLTSSLSQQFTDRVVMVMCDVWCYQKIVQYQQKCDQINWDTPWKSTKKSYWCQIINLIQETRDWTDKNHLWLQRSH